MTPTPVFAATRNKLAADIPETPSASAPARTAAPVANGFQGIVSLE